MSSTPAEVNQVVTASTVSLLGAKKSITSWALMCLRKFGDSGDDLDGQRLICPSKGAESHMSIKTSWPRARTSRDCLSEMRMGIMVSAGTAARFDQ
jgi:hypothetical protein